jgi:biopolymer transport protein ExbD
MIYVPSRVKRHKHKFAITTGLNLVSLMDIFTILLLFLLVHVTGEDEIIQIPDIVRLPVSAAYSRPEPTTAVYVTPAGIFVGDKRVAEARDVLNSTESSIEGLERELLKQAEMEKDVSGSKRKIIIMGDKTIPFTLLKKVMYTCARGGYPAISLAVVQKE